MVYTSNFKKLSLHNDDRRPQKRLYLNYAQIMPEPGQIGPNSTKSCQHRKTRNALMIKGLRAISNTYQLSYFEWFWS